jgi:hypothetical protein
VSNRGSIPCYALILKPIKMSNSTADLIVKLYNNYTKEYNVSINNLELDKARNLLMRMSLLDDVIKKYELKTN